MPSILLYEIEPIFPRGPGEIDPGIKGPYAQGVPLNLPYPTSITGIIATTLYNLGIIKTSLNRSSSVEEWYKDIEELLNLESPYNVLRGPYIIITYDNKREILLPTINGFTELSKLFNIIAVLGKYWLQGEYTREEYMEKKNKLSTILIRKVLQERVNISLKENQKIIREHYLTTLSLIEHRKLIDYINPSLKAKARIAIGIDLYTDEKNVLEHISKIPVRVLGRSRVGVLTIHKNVILENEIQKLCKSWDRKIEQASLALYVVSPILLSFKKKTSRINSGTMSTFYSKVYPGLDNIFEYIEAELENICDNKIEDMMIDGLTSIIGLGYSLKFHKRKPLYNAILPGSLIYIKVSDCKITLRDLYIRGIGELKHLGYGTIIPIPIEK